MKSTLPRRLALAPAVASRPPAGGLARQHDTEGWRRRWACCVQPNAALSAACASPKPVSGGVRIAGMHVRIAYASVRVRVCAVRVRVRVCARARVCARVCVLRVCAPARVCARRTWVWSVKIVYLCSVKRVYLWSVKRFVV